MKKYQIHVNGVPYEVDVELIEDDEEEQHAPGAYIPTMLPRSDAPRTTPMPRVVTPTVRPVTKGSTADSSQVTSPLTGTVAKVAVKEGQNVKWHEVLLEIDAMKMITKIYAQDDGKVLKVHVKEGDAVQMGQQLLTMAEE
ncbi:MAG: biotin/lipoyl-binding protein [bacterium]|nr:biotin/lipoyl-binding protein [bacterium]